MIRCKTSLADVAAIVALACSTALASDLDVSVTSDGSNAITVVPCGGTVAYEVTGLLSDTDNEGLAGFLCDLAFTGGPLDPADQPVGGSMLNFASPLGMTGGGGFGGAPVGGTLVHVGGSQNSIGNTPDNAPSPIGAVITGVAHVPELLVNGSLTAPVEPGTYALTLSNLRATVIQSGETGPDFWVVETAGAGTISNLTVEVLPADPPATATNDGPVCDGDGVPLLGGPDGMVGYSWTGPDGFTSTEQSPVVSPSVPGVYVLMVTDGNDCIDWATTAVSTIPGLCEPVVDCNTNGVHDACDLIHDTSADCNGNEIPDECDIAAGTSLDLDGNGIPDECAPSDVSDLVDVGFSDLRYDRPTGQSSAMVTITNTSAAIISSPLHLAINSITPSALTLVDPDGNMPDGRPYVDYSDLLGDGLLDPGEMVGQRIAFHNPDRARFLVEVSLYGVVEDPPLVPPEPMFFGDLTGTADFDADGDVDFDDLNVFVEVLLGIDTNLAHVAIADTNLDGMANGRDIQTFLGAMLQS